MGANVTQSHDMGFAFPVIVQKANFEPTCAP